MKAPKLRISDAAAADILEQAEWYSHKSGSKLAQRWERAVTRALFGVLRIPKSGAPCNFTNPELTGVRRIPIEGFPKHLIFYRLLESELVVLRVVHGARDLESLF